ncbi:PLDc N-terminal domain-containing protein [Marinifilum sp. D714]|uniref:PLDc N-terminal domain-containing protein n=1 Tax=Marinifilum sp. D714 TaxID=2937523 RepID=UPI00359CA8B9
MMDYLVVILIVLSAVLWIWSLYDILSSRHKNKTGLIWLLAIFLLPMIGPIIYFQFKKR